MLIKQCLLLALSLSTLQSVIKEVKIAVLFKNAPITHMALSPDGKLLACTSIKNDAIKIIDLKTKKVKHQIFFEMSKFNSLVFSSSDTILVGRTDGWLEKIGLYKGQNIQVFKIFETGSVSLARSKGMTYPIVYQGGNYSARIIFKKDTCVQDKIQGVSCLSRDDVLDEFTHMNNGYSIIANKLDMSNGYSLWSGLVISDKKEVVETVDKWFGIASFAWHQTEPYLFLGMPDGSLWRRIILKAQ